MDERHLRRQQALLRPAENGRGGGGTEDRIDTDPDAQLRCGAGELRPVGEVGSGDLIRRQRRQAQGEQRVIAGEVPVVQAGEIAGPLPVPVGEVRAHGGVHTSDARVDQGLDGLVGVGGGA
ncbi:hypothetical protein ACQFX6_00835 [Streptomyces sp. DSM 41987]|uniref:hypothetical protein n=1 Tax=Streptomyces TaxID=1883 RepID=UPI0027BA2BBD|nr:hypothetical protein [Streptomyces fildesensis]